MRHKFSKCYSGLTDFNQASSLYGLQCREHDFDCCLKCLLHAVIKNANGELDDLGIEDLEEE